jgi:hypothetical protein
VTLTELAALFRNGEKRGLVLLHLPTFRGRDRELETAEKAVMR